MKSCGEINFPEISNITIKLIKYNCYPLNNSLFFFYYNTHKLQSQIQNQNQFLQIKNNFFFKLQTTLLLMEFLMSYFNKRYHR
jgi:hypothetical protein